MLGVISKRESTLKEASNAPVLLTYKEVIFVIGLPRESFSTEKLRFIRSFVARIEKTLVGVTGSLVLITKGYRARSVAIPRKTPLPVEKVKFTNTSDVPVGTVSLIDNFAEALILSREV
jgi:hypothetical protein